MKKPTRAEKPLSAVETLAEQKRKDAADKVNGFASLRAFDMPDGCTPAITDSHKQLLEIIGDCARATANIHETAAHMFIPVLIPSIARARYDIRHNESTGKLLDKQWAEHHEKIATLILSFQQLEKSLQAIEIPNPPIA